MIEDEPEVNCRFSTSVSLTLLSALCKTPLCIKTECPLLTKVEYNMTSNAPEGFSGCFCDKSTTRLNSGRDFGLFCMVSR